MSLQRTTDLFQALSDASRLRMLAVLSRHELSVAELVEALGLVQSRVSTHLSRLKDAGLVAAIKDGAATRWALDASGLDGSGQQIWAAMRPELGASHFTRDAERAAAVVARRAAPKGSWPESVAGEMEKHYSPGRTWESMAHALAGLIELGDVLDVGAGDGTVAALLAPHTRSYTCLDSSERLVAAARARLKKVANAAVVRGDAEALPFPSASFDAVLLSNVLSCLARPEVALVEAARVLRPGGRLVVVTLDRHEHLDLVERFGHVQPGMAPSRLRSLLERAGLVVSYAAITSREKREPRFGVVTAVARKAASQPTGEVAGPEAPEHNSLANRAPEHRALADQAPLKSRPPARGGPSGSPRKSTGSRTRKKDRP